MKQVALDEHKQASVPEDDICESKVMLNGMWRKREHSSRQSAVIGFLKIKVCNYIILDGLEGDTRIYCPRC